MPNHSVVKMHDWLNTCRYLALNLAILLGQFIKVVSIQYLTHYQNFMVQEMKHIIMRYNPNQSFHSGVFGHVHKIFTTAFRS